MGIFSDIKASKDIQKLFKGESVKLSISQVVNLIISLVDAYKNLDRRDYRRVMNKYEEMRKCKNKIVMTSRKDYYEVCADIITEFNKIAPWESYSGLSPWEASMIMEELRKRNESKTRNENARKEFACKMEDDLYNTVKEKFPSKGTTTTLSDLLSADKKVEKEEAEETLSPAEIDVVKEIVDLADNSAMKVDQEDAEKLVEIIRTYNKKGKNEALQEFESFKEELKEKYGLLKSVQSVPFLIGTLSAAYVIGKEEANVLSSNYVKEVMNELREKNESKTPAMEVVPFWDRIIEKLREGGMPAVASALTGTQGVILDDSTIGISGVDGFKKMILEKPENMGAIKILVSLECKKDMQIKFID